MEALHQQQLATAAENISTVNPSTYLPDTAVAPTTTTNTWGGCIEERETKPQATFDPNVGFVLLLPVFAAVVLGGIGSAYGALAGGLALGIVQELST